MITRYAQTPLAHTKGPAWASDNQNEYGETTGSPTTILGRVEAGTRRVLDAHGVEHQASTTVFTEAEVRAGDTLALDGTPMTVLAVFTERDLAGVVRFYEVTC